jgi:hypothetical protein
MILWESHTRTVIAFTETAAVAVCAGSENAITAVFGRF